MTKLIHYHSVTAAAVPLPANMQVGQLAINHADKAVYILDSASGNVVKVAQFNFGTVKTVNAVAPDGTGAVTLTPTNLGASTVGNSVFTAASADAAQTALGATTVGKAVFTAASQAAATTALGAIPTSAIGAASGVVPLDSSSKISTSYLPDAILGGVNYKGSYNASTNTPTLVAAAAANKGWYYIVTVAGTVTPPSGTALTLTVGDWVISDGTTWTKVDAQDAVLSVAGRTGVITLTTADIASGTFTAQFLGASSGNSLVLTTNSSGVPTWAATVPAANLPVATTSAQGIVQVGSGLTVTAGTIAVDTTNLTLDEGTF